MYDTAPEEPIMKMLWALQSDNHTPYKIEVSIDMLIKMKAYREPLWSRGFNESLDEFCGFKISVDPSLKPDEFKIYDKRGKMLCSNTNIQ